MSLSNARIKGKFLLRGAYSAFAVFMTGIFFDGTVVVNFDLGYLVTLGFGLLFIFVISLMMIRCENCKTWLAFDSNDGETQLEGDVDLSSHCPKCGIERR